MKIKYKLLLFLTLLSNANAFELNQEKTFAEKYHLNNINNYIDVETGIILERKSFYNELILDNKRFEFPFLLYKNTYNFYTKIISKKIYIPNINIYYESFEDSYSTDTLIQLGDTKFDNTENSNNLVDYSQDLLTIDLNFNLYKNNFFQYQLGTTFINESYKLNVSNESENKFNSYTRNNTYLLLYNKFSLNISKSTKISYTNKYSSDYNVDILDIETIYNNYIFGASLSHEEINEEISDTDYYKLNKIGINFKIGYVF